MTRDDLFARVVGLRKTAQGWEGFCPAHDDQKRRSWTYAERDGRRLIHCFAGCPLDAMASALGTTVAELLHDAPGAKPAERRIAATYRYEDEAGAPLYDVVRFEPKDFRPRRLDGVFTLKDVRLVLYRLPHLAERRRIYHVEGEKDADALGALGLAVTTTQGGANAWRREYAEQLKALAPDEVVGLPDNDEAGEGYVAAAMRDCLALGLVYKVVRLPGLPPKGDASDWLAAGGTVADLEALADAAGAASTPCVAASTSVHWATVLDELLATLGQGGPTSLPTPYHDLNNYLSGGIAPGELVYLGAYPGVGKTALLLEFARGAAEHGVSALVFSREMVNLALARRLLAQGARVSAAGLKRGDLGDEDLAKLSTALPKLRGLPIWLNQVAASMDEIADEVARFAASPPLGLVLVDYLQLVRGSRGGLREGRRLEVEAASQGLKALALRHRLPVVCASSLARGARPKDEEEKKARRPSIDLLRESGELEHDADIILLLHRDFGASKTECKIAKNRDGRTGTAHLLFREDWVAFDEDDAIHP